MLPYLTRIAVGLAALLGFAASAAAAQVTVTLWSWTPDTVTTNAMVAAIEKAHPDIHVQATIEPHTPYFTAIKAAQASGTLPDIMGLTPGAITQEYRPDLQALDQVAAGAWGANWETNFAPALLTQARLGNPKGDQHIYILPQEAEVLNIWYDRAAFAKAGITEPPATFDELAADSAKLKKAGFIGFYQGAGTGLFVRWVFMQIAAQTDLKDLLAAQEGAPVWTNPGMIDAAKVWQQLFTRHIVQAGALSALQYPTGANLFAAGRVGMISLGSWWLQESHLSQNPALVTMSGYGKFFFPAIKSGGHASPPLGGIDVGWGLTKNAAKSADVEPAATVVLKELVSGVGEQVALDKLDDLPAFKGMQPQPPLTGHIKDLYDTYIAELAQAAPHHIGSPVIADALTANLQAVGAGTKTPEDAMAAVQKVAEGQAAN
jgi:raffinose/stachyose/melibiose transport system substrate-binding protein